MTTTTLKGVTRLVGAGTGFGIRYGMRALGATLERHRSRRALARLDERLLADVGLSLEEARRELEKPFWAS